MRHEGCGFCCQKEVLALAATVEVEENKIPAKKKLMLSKIKYGGEDATNTTDLKTSDPSKTVIIGSNLSSKQEDKLVTFLCANSDIFAWKYSDMPIVHA